ncbi:hypothetical protein BH24GEM2_BH24GEM2_05080 [soil metagenome]
MLKVWGDNSSSQISDAPTGHIKAVAGGSFQSLALRSDGTPVLWGGSAELPTGRFHAGAMGRDDGVLIRQNGAIVAFGQNAELQSVPTGSYKAVTVAAKAAVAIKSGALTAWGLDNVLLNPQQAIRSRL